MGEEHKNSLTGVEALKLAGNLMLRLHDKLADDGKISMQEWLELATATGKDVFDEYSDEDDI